MSNEVYDYLKKQDLRKLLGIDTQSNFIDIFHEETNPSASIFQSKEGNGHWLYKCHSYSSPFSGTIFHVIEKLLNCTTGEAKRFLMKLYRIEVHESDAVKELRNLINEYKKMLNSEELKYTYPNFYKVFSRYGYLHDFCRLIDMSSDFVYGTNPRMTNFYGIRKLAENLGRSPTVIATRMNFFAFFNLVKKLDEDEIETDLLNTFKRRKKQSKYQYMSSCYEIPIYTPELFCMIEEKCKVWIEKNCSSRTISYEGIYRTFGRDEADRVFPQDKGKQIAELNEDVVSLIHKTTLRLIKRKGWTTESEVLDNIVLYFKGQKEFKKTQIKRCIGEMIDAYDLEIINSSKKIKEEMGITEEVMSKFSFPKLIRRKLIEETPVVNI